MKVNTAGRMLMITGVIFFGAGLLFTFGGRLGLGRLPGDLVLRRGSFVLYAPLGTALALSVALSVVLNLVVRFLHRP